MTSGRAGEDVGELSDDEGEGGVVDVGRGVGVRVQGGGVIDLEEIIRKRMR